VRPRRRAAALLAQAARQVEKTAATSASTWPAPTTCRRRRLGPPPVDPVQQRLSEEVRNLVLVSEMGQTFARQQGEAACWKR
jgi:hypothetical protein